MSRPIWKKKLALTLLVALAGACKTGMEPENPNQFDAEAAFQDHEALEIILQSDAMKGFRALGAGMESQSVSPEVDFALRVGRDLLDSPSPVRGEQVAGRILSAVAEIEGGTWANPVISVFRRGKTFVFDPDLGRYVIDEDLSGAPATGVRFILYRPGIGGKPDPTAEMGYVDLIDEGDDSTQEIALRLMVVQGGETRLDYRATVDVLADGGEVTVAGFLQGDADRLDFDIGVRGSAGSQDTRLDINFMMGIEARDFLITGSVAGISSDSGNGGEINLLVEHGSDSFQVSLVGSETSIDGTFHLNGDLFATVTGDPEAPTITGASGAPLTWIEGLVLRQILDSSEDVFDFWEDLLDPVDELVILAIIL